MRCNFAAENIYAMRFLGFILFSAALLTCPMAASAQDQNAENAEEEKEDVIVPPEYKGGMEEMYKFILDNFQYPEDSKKRNVRGTAEVEFTIEKSGDMSAISIIKGIDPDIDEELLRVFKAMPMWTPATRNGNPVRYKVFMPVTLKLSRTNKNGFT